MNNNNNDRNRFESTRFLATRDALHQANDWFGGSRAQQTATAQAQRCCCISPNLVFLSFCLSVCRRGLSRQAIFIVGALALIGCASCTRQSLWKSSHTWAHLLASMCKASKQQQQQQLSPWCQKEMKLQESLHWLIYYAAELLKKKFSFLRMRTRAQPPPCCAREELMRRTNELAVRHRKERIKTIDCK